jgi:hypothetical protein
MEYRKPKLTKDDAVDCEINHPVYGWVPYTAVDDPNDPLMREVYKKARKTAEPYTPPPPPTPKEAADLKVDLGNKVMTKFEATSPKSALLLVTFSQENRVRALEGKKPLTMEQFKEWVKSQL